MKTKQLVLSMLIMLVGFCGYAQNPFTEILNDPGFQAAVDADVPTRDQVILDDLIVVGSLCVGFDCVNMESFGFDTVRLKENNLRIHFQDTSTSASFPTNDWRISINDSSNGGENYFGIDDVDAGTRPFKVEAGSGANAMVISDSGGNVGLGTATPVVELQITDGDTPTMRLEQNGTNGFTPQTWDVAGNETNFFVRDVTNGSALPFKIIPGASNNALVIRGESIGVGGSGNAVNANASIDLKSTSGGLLLNRLTTGQRTGLANEAGMIVYDTDLSLLFSNDGAVWTPVGVDDQNISGSGFAANILTIGIEGGTSEMVDLSSLDDAGTDDQNISGSGFAGNMLTIGIESGASEMVDLSSLDDAGTDDQNISGSGLAGNILTIGIEGGTSETVDLSSLDDMGTDDQVLNNFLLSGPILGLTIENGNAVNVNMGPLLDDLEMENAAQQAQIDDLINENAAQQTMLDDLLARLIALEDCACMTLGIDDNDAEPDTARLHQNVPNPFDGFTTIGYYIPFHHSKANIAITATSGQRIQDIPITKFGEGSIQIDESRLQAAIYFYTLYVDGKRIDTKRMVVK